MKTILIIIVCFAQVDLKAVNVPYIKTGPLVPEMDIGNDRVFIRKPHASLKAVYHYPTRVG
jgi:hypothetical protein